MQVRKRVTCQDLDALRLLWRTPEGLEDVVILNRTPASYHNALDSFLTRAEETALDCCLNPLCHAVKLDEQDAGCPQLSVLVLAFASTLSARSPFFYLACLVGCLTYLYLSLRQDTSRKLYKCDRCGVARYHSRKCQEAHWRDHSARCIPESLAKRGGKGSSASTDHTHTLVRKLLADHLPEIRESAALVTLAQLRWSVVWVDMLAVPARGLLHCLTGRPR